MGSYGMGIGSHGDGDEMPWGWEETSWGWGWDTTGMGMGSREDAMFSSLGPATSCLLKFIMSTVPLPGQGTTKADWMSNARQVRKQHVGTAMMRTDEARMCNSGAVPRSYGCSRGRAGSRSVVY